MGQPGSFTSLRPSSDAVLHMSRIECKREKSFVILHLMAYDSAHVKYVHAHSANSTTNMDTFESALQSGKRINLQPQGPTCQSILNAIAKFASISKFRCSPETKQTQNVVGRFFYSLAEFVSNSFATVGEFSVFCKVFFSQIVQARNTANRGRATVLSCQKSMCGRWRGAL